MNKKLTAASVAAIVGGVVGLSGVAAAMDFSLYGSIRGGYYQQDTDDVTTETPVTRSNTTQGTSGVADETIVYLRGFIDPTSEDDGRDEDGSDDVDITDADGAIIRPDAVALVTRNTGTGDNEGRDSSDFGATGASGGGGAWSISRIGIRGSEDLGGGSAVGFHIERVVNGNSLNVRHQNVWISGGGSKLTIGQQGNPYRKAANWDQSWFLGGNNRFDDGGSRNEGIHYNFSNGPFSLSLMATGDDADQSSNGATLATICANSSTNPADGSDVLTNCDQLDVDVAATDAHILVTTEDIDDEDSVDSFVATAHYTFGDYATVNLGFQTNNVEANEPGESYDNAVISVNGSVGAFGWYVGYESNDDNVNEASITNVAADGGAVAPTGTAATPGLDLANNIVQQREAQDAETLGVFLSAGLSENDLIYLEYEDSSVDGYDALGEEELDRDAVLIGYSRSFAPHATFIAEYASVSTDSDATADVDRLLAVLKVDF